MTISASPGSARYPVGAPVWSDMVVPDLERATAFYRALLGWDFEGEGYVTATLDGRRVAAFSEPWGEPSDPTERCNWTTYLATDDIDAALRVVEDAGGAVVVAHQEIGDTGGMAIAREPAGTVFGLWRPGLLRGAEAHSVPGAPLWAEVTSKDTQTTSAALARVFGYTTERMSGFDYTTLISDGAPVCGVYGGADERVSEGHGAWLTYFGVVSADAAVQAAEERGGRALRAAANSPYGRWAMIADPFGAHFAAMEVSGG
ncbi:VOC family protein [Nocardiopsis sediminis]|uniref:VOC family protein n=1 Tax=Nocardiopsis sediminis TaxID=1778267 RepID=A0ABV8FH73_9ACTN